MNIKDHLSDEIINAILSAKKVCALTGAGVSAESGVPTFRGEEGLWHNYRAEELATPEAFARDPKLVWRWYDWRRTLIAPLEPNPGHYALAEFENIFDGMTLITQNVDGLHRLAGSTEPVELHGNIWRTRCVAEGTLIENRETPLKETPPRCGKCQGLLRPHIVWFGESLEPVVIEKAWNAAQRCDLFIVAGTSGVVQPAASLAEVAKRGGATVIEINLERTPISDEMDVTLLGKSGEVLPEIVKLFA